MKNKDKDKNEEEFNALIAELRAMPFSGNLSKAEAAAQEKRINEIEAIINAKSAEAPVHMRGIFERMTRRGQ